MTAPGVWCVYVQARRHSDLDLPSFDHDGESAIKDIEARHRESRVKMEQDMSERHNDMLLRRAEKYRSRASSLALSAEDRETVDKLIEDFIAKEKDMLDARMTAKTDRMRPTGDMRDAAVKEQFKADLRRSIDERKESDRVMRDEARDIRQRLEEILNSHAGADL